MKKYAYYLPQYHCIPENDKWWGKGFTEWTNVKSAVPLFKGHVQPKIPLKNNYYFLDDLNTLKWQAELAKKYRVDGMIFYHYYFCGKKLLEKPAEMLLKNKDIPMNFFFCWANHSWNRSWDGTKELLIEQLYGKETDWENHFQYLLPFFQDVRYQKEDNKPLLMFYNCSFKQKKEMITYFNKRCFDYGFNGICSIEKCNSYNIDQLFKTKKEANSSTRYVYIREPEAAGTCYLKNPKNIIIKIKTFLKEYFPKIEYKKLIQYNGDLLFEYMTKNSINQPFVIRGLFFEWDNTPRHKRRGYVISPPSKENFMKYMDSIEDSDYVFINAWNEWSEGMMLEPSEKNGYKYLEWIKEWSDNNDNRVNGV